MAEEILGTIIGGKYRLLALRQGRYQDAISAYELLLQAGPDFLEDYISQL
jgi:hypothetical protein